MSDRWQYVVGGIISLVLAMAYLTLTDEASSRWARDGLVTPDQAQDAPSPEADPAAEFEALHSGAHRFAVAPLDQSSGVEPQRR